MRATNSIKQLNINIIREFMKTNKSASKSDISRATGLSFPTITRFIDLLCSTGEVIDLGEGAFTGGRNAATYKLNSLFSLSLLVRFENNKVNWMLKDLEDNTIESDNFKISSKVLQKLDDIVLDIYNRYENLKVIVIGLAEMVTDGLVDETFSATDLKGVNLKLHFEHLINIPIVIENDVNLLALGQQVRKKTKLNSSVCIYMGDNGLGAGIVIEGKIWNGRNGFTGELMFLPFIQDELLKNKNDFSKIDIIDCYNKLIQTFSIIINPDEVVLYNNEFISGKIHEIRKRCLDKMPNNTVPQIELSNNFDIDYENGMISIAHKIIYENINKTERK